MQPTGQCAPRHAARVGQHGILRAGWQPAPFPPFYRQPKAPNQAAESGLTKPPQVANLPHKPKFQQQYSTAPAVAKSFPQFR